jgi:hypothetical protein
MLGSMTILLCFVEEEQGETPFSTSPYPFRGVKKKASKWSIVLAIRYLCHTQGRKNENDQQGLKREVTT